MVAGQPELRKDDEVRAAGPGLGQNLAMTGEILVQQAQSWCELRKGDTERLHRTKSIRGWAYYASIAVSITDCLAAES